MERLRLVSVTDADELVLMAGDGRQFTVGVDDELRAAVRRTRRPPLPRPEAAPSRPGPREVQARIRAGESADDVAARTGLDVEYVRRFEGPVLAEREHVARLASASQVERGSGSRAVTLEESVVDAIAAEGLDPSGIEWDSRRVEGTRWDVVVTHGSGDEATRATWRYDTATRGLEALDPDAQRFSGPPRPRRLTAVREDVFDVEQASRQAASQRGGTTAELLDVLARQRGRRPSARNAPADTLDEAGDDVSDGGPYADDADDGHGHGHSGHDDDPGAWPEPDRRGRRGPYDEGPSTGPAYPSAEPEAASPSARPSRPVASGRARDQGQSRGTTARRPAGDAAAGNGRGGPELDDLAAPGITPELLRELDVEPAATRRRRSTRLPTDGLPEETPPVQEEPRAGRSAAGTPQSAAQAPSRAPARTPAADRAPAARGSAEEAPQQEESASAERAAPAPRPAPTRTGARPAVTTEQAEQAETSPRQAPSRSRQRRRRATVPSWDDIVFGARREDE